MHIGRSETFFSATHIACVVFYNISRLNTCINIVFTWLIKDHLQHSFINIQITNYYSNWRIPSRWNLLNTKYSKVITCTHNWSTSLVKVKMLYMHNYINCLNVLITMEKIHILILCVVIWSPNNCHSTTPLSKTLSVTGKVIRNRYLLRYDAMYIEILFLNFNDSIHVFSFCNRSDFAFLFLKL